MRALKRPVDAGVVAGLIHGDGHALEKRRDGVGPFPKGYGNGHETKKKQGPVLSGIRISHFNRVAAKKKSFRLDWQKKNAFLRVSRNEDGPEGRAANPTHGGVGAVAEAAFRKGRGHRRVFMATRKQGKQDKGPVRADTRRASWSRGTDKQPCENDAPHTRRELVYTLGRDVMDKNK